MVIMFPKEEDNSSSEDKLVTYNHVANQYLYFLKQLSNCRFFYWNGLVIFVLAIFASFILYAKGMIPSAQLGILVAGIGCLLIFIQNIRKDFEYGIKMAASLETGMRIEKKYAFPVKLFGIYDAQKRTTYRGHLLSRLCPLGLIALSTTGAAVLLAIKAGVWLVFVTGLFSIAVLCLATKSYIKTTRKTILGD